MMTKVPRMHVGHVMLEVLKVKAPPLPARGASSYVGREMRENTQRIPPLPQWVRRTHVQRRLWMLKASLGRWTNGKEDPFGVVQ